MTTLQVAVPDEFVRLMGSEHDAEEHLRRAAVLDLVRRGRMSQGRGAELLDIGLWDFQELMADAGVPMVDLDESELVEGHRNLQGALSGDKC